MFKSIFKNTQLLIIREKIQFIVNVQKVSNLCSICVRVSIIILLGSLTIVGRNKHAYAIYTCAFHALPFACTHPYTHT